MWNTKQGVDGGHGGSSFLVPVECTGLLDPPPSLLSCEGNFICSDT